MVRPLREEPWFISGRDSGILSFVTDELRVGGVPYGVGDPLLVGLDQEAGLDFVRRPPRLLARMLRDRDLDAALVSSVEAFRRPGYQVAARHGICCNGPVKSVRTFTSPGVGGERPITRIGLDDGSESSVALLRILLADGVFGAVDPDVEFERIEPTRDPDALPHDLVLLIGDIGLGARPGARRVHDLGQVWRERTGLAFVFAVWLIVPEVTGERRERLVDALDRAAERGARDEPRGAARPDGTHHVRGAAEERGLEEFRRRAVELGLADADCVPRML